VLPAPPGALVTFNAADFNDFAARHGLVLLSEQM
jgi:hypothetical protein